MKHFLHILIFLVLANYANANRPSRVEGFKSLIEENVDSSIFQLHQVLLAGDYEPHERPAFLSLLGEAWNKKGNLDSSNYYFIKSNEFYRSLKGFEHQVVINNKFIANNYYHLGLLKKSDSLFQVCLSDVRNSSDYKLQAEILLDAGWLAREQGRHAEALDYYFKAKLIGEINQDKSILADAFTKIAVVYHVKEELEIAKKYYDQSLEILKELNDSERIARLYNNYGLLYDMKGDYTTAISYFEKSIEMCDSAGNERGVAISNENLGLICYSYLKNYSLALKRFNNSLAFWRKSNDIYGQSQTFVYKLYVYNAQKRYQTTLDSGFVALSLCLKSGARDVERDVYNEISIAYEGLGKSALAFLFYKKHITLRDSLEAYSSSEEIKIMGIEKELETKMVKDSLNLVVQHEKESAGIKLDIEQQKFWTYILLLGLIGIVIIAILFLMTAQQRKKAAASIAAAHTQLQEKNKEVIDSITYAKRIQEAILPKKEKIDAAFKESFVYYKPKDIVAGDFYWLEEVITDSGEVFQFFAVADCTGHGVPGAMVSVICSGALNKVVNEMKVLDPAEILESVSKLVVETFDKGENMISDGMDISLCRINKATRELNYAGANNALWVISDQINKPSFDSCFSFDNSNLFLYELKANKRPIGRYHKKLPFVSRSVELSSNDKIYLFTDGYADQFGGEKNKKFKYRTLKKLLLSIASLSFGKQKVVLDNSLNEWMGNLEQLDDVCIVGIKI